MKVQKNSWMIWLMQVQFQIPTRRLFDDKSDYNPMWDIPGKIPKSLCGFFRALVAAILIIPFNIPGIIIAYFVKDKNNGGPQLGISNPILMFLFQVLSIIIGSAILYAGNEDSMSALEFIYSFFVGIIAVAISSVIFVSLVGGFIWIKEQIESKINEYKWKKNKAKENKPKKEKKPNVFFEFIKAKKRKVCPIIDFTNED